MNTISPDAARRGAKLFWCVACLALMAPVVGQAQDPIADWKFVPEYVLPGSGANYPGPRIPHPKGDQPLVATETASLLFHGERPTQRLSNFLATDSIPREGFTIETWLVHHVNQPVGILIAAKGKKAGSSVPWSLGFHNWTSSFTMEGADGSTVQLQSRMGRWTGYKQRWVHLVAVYDGHDVQLYRNGEVVASGHMHHHAIAWPDELEFEMAAYMENEPFMQWANLVNHVRIYKEPLSKEQINKNFFAFQEPVEQGHLFSDLFHFTAGPYLNLATENSINVVWETDRPTTATLHWGRTSSMGESMMLGEKARLHTATIEGLEPNTPYFYRIECQDVESEETIDSGILTFKSAVKEGQPYRFAVIGDTESRPHVNDRLSKLVWDERPNFLINLGDLTDGGQELHRYEWTHEYFLGMNQLTSRVPVFAVPGNGEGDLYWYNHYHDYPEPEGYYQFRFGDAAFFMLDSNQREKEFAEGGKQYKWLEEQLSKCDARWKFVCHHHATFTGEEDDYGNAWEEESSFGDAAVRRIVPLYEKYGVDMVMFGHLHLYERSLPIRDGHVDFNAGVVHLLAGGGGGNLEDFAPTPAFFSAKTHRGHHYVIIDMHDNTMIMRMYDTDGDIRDSFTIEKNEKGEHKVTRNKDE